MTLVGGLLVILPIWLAVLLLMKAFAGVLGLLKPLARLAAQDMVNDYVLAIVMMVALCFVTGLLVRTQCVRRPGEWLEVHILERMPGYQLCAA